MWILRWMWQDYKGSGAQQSYEIGWFKYVQLTKAKATNWRTRLLLPMLLPFWNNGSLHYCWRLWLPSPFYFDLCLKFSASCNIWHTSHHRHCCCTTYICPFPINNPLLSSYKLGILCIFLLHDGQEQRRTHPWMGACHSFWPMFSSTGGGHNNR